MARNGYYTMDKISCLTGQDDVGDIPVKLLLERSRTQAVTTNVLSFLPVTHMSSAFNAMVELTDVDSEEGQEMMMSAFCFVQMLEYYENVNPMLLTPAEMNKVTYIFCMVIKIGIGTKFVTRLQLRWLVAEGPQPVGFDLERAFAIMQAAHYMLFKYGIHIADYYEVGHNMRAMFRSDLNNQLRNAWSGVNGWQR